MTDGWVLRRWGDIATIEYGKSLRDYGDRVDGYRVYGTNGPIGWHDAPLYAHPSVIIGRKGAYRGIHYSPEPFFVIDTAFFLKPTQPMDMRWAYYELLTHDINSMDSGSAIPSTSREDFYALPVLVPPLEEQRAIASVLGALDDKIDLNRRMNETLEAIARAIFKSWFVDFDPVRAKAGGEQPWGMDAATAALFPDAFEDSELGEIPQGWTVMNVPEAFEVNPQRRLAAGAVAPYLPMSAMPTDSARPHEWELRDAGSGARFVNGDVLVARITPCLENGKTAFVDFLDEGQVGWGSTEYIVLRSKPPLPLHFAYLFARTADFRMFAIGNMTGTSGRQRVPVDCLNNFKLAVPDEQVARAFERMVEPTFASMRQRDEESTTLAELRDTLLPKLLSGEVRVGAAEQMVEAVS